MPTYLQEEVATPVPQTESLDSRQSKNNAGGYSYTVDKWSRLDRWLILGSEGGTYYADQRKHTKQNIDCLKLCVQEDGVRTVDRVVEISDAGRAPKNDQAIFALAYASCYGNDRTRALANANLQKVCRIGTHLFQWASFVDGMKGWSRGRRSAVAQWYLDKKVGKRMKGWPRGRRRSEAPQWYLDEKAGKLAYQLLKYQQRDGWSHRDLLRLSHPVATSQTIKDLFQFVTSGDVGQKEHELVRAYRIAHKEGVKPKMVAALVIEHGLTREMLPTEMLKSKVVWEALLENMPMTAMIRNLGVMSSIGLLKPLSKAVQKVCSQLRNEDFLKKARVHPIQILAALLTYKQGRGTRGSLTWKVVPAILSALDDAFYNSFDFVEPTGKNFYIGVDVSGSMCQEIAGVPGLSAAMGAAALAMVTARTEDNYHIMGFAGEMRDLGITPRDSLTDALKKTRVLNFGQTDCALPMVDALERGLEVDRFMVLTDSETYFGDVHPMEALKTYRHKMARPATLAVVGMTATEFTIADPQDSGCLDVVGFDTATPQLLAEFSKGF